MDDYTDFDISAYPDAREAMAKPVSVKVRFAHGAGIQQTLEGPVPYCSGDALVVGNAGEQWPVGRERFLQAYIPQPLIDAGCDGEYIKRPAHVWVLQIREAFCVQLKDRNAMLYGAPGDWLVQHEHGDTGIVRDAIFPSLYELL